MYCRRTLAIASALLLVLVTSGWAATLEVSQPVQVTSDAYYERGQSIVHDGTNYWLFYGRSASCTDPYSSGDPDIHDYAIYYKKAATVAGLVSATPVAVPGATDCYLGETGAAVVDGNVWTFGTVPSLNFVGAKSLYGWYTGDGGTSWTQVADLWDDMPSGAAHHDETGFDGKLYIMANYPESYSGWYTKWTDDPTAGSITWSAPIPLNSTSNLINGTGHFYVEGTDLYIGILRTSPTKDNKVLEYSTGPEVWTELCTASSTGWDGTLFKVGTDYVYAQAPWVSPRQYIIEWTGTTPSNVLSGSSHMVSEGKYGANGWVDMWPIGFTDDGGTSYLFFTSERDQPSAEGVGNIWYLEFAWDPENDHYTYVQEAINASSGGDVVNVSAGTYAERLNISSGIDLRGAQYGVDPNLGGRTDPSAESIVTELGLSTPNPDVLVEIGAGATGASVDGFTLEGDPTNPTADTSTLRIWADGVTVGSNIITGRLGVLYKGADGLTVDQNHVAANKNGLVCQPGATTNVTISDNTFELGSTPAGDESAMYLTSVTGGAVSGNTAMDWVNGKGCGGSNLTNVDVTGNTFHQNKDGVSFWGNTTFIDIFGNRITSNSRYGISIKGQDITISNNELSYSGTAGVNVERHVIDTERVSINGNAFNAFWTAADLDIRVDTVNVTETVDASGNYYGTVDPAAVRDAANGGDGVDYTPWTEAGTYDNPGYTPDYSVLYVDDDSDQTGTDGRVQEAAELVDGSTVHILGGTYPASLVFDAAWDKDGVVFDGDDSDQPELTGGVHFLQTAQIDGITFRDLTFKGVAAGAGGVIDFDNSGTVNDLVIDGCLLDGELVADRLGLIGNKLGGTLTVTDTEMKDVLGWALMDFDSSYGGPPVGGNELPLTTITFADNYVHECNGSISLRGNHADLTDVANIYGNVFENIGGNAGEVGQHWAALELNHCDVANVYGNTVDNVTEGEWTEGQAFQFWDIGTLNFHNNFVLNCHQGIYFFDGGAANPYGGPYSIPGGAVEYNAFVGNTQYGISVGTGCTGGPLDAEMNWWGDASGPSGIGPGTGDACLGSVDYDPWIGKTGGENIVCDADPEYLSVADPTKTVDVEYLGGGSGLVYGYTVKLTWDGAIASTAPGSVIQGDLLSGGVPGATFWDCQTTDTNEITVTCIQLGAQPGVTGPGTMFSIPFTGVSVGTSDIDIAIDRFRDSANQTLSGFYEDDGLLIVDVDDPVVANVHIANDDPDVSDTYVKNGDPVTVTADVSDDDPLFDETNIVADLRGLGLTEFEAPDDYTGGVASWYITAPPGVTCDPTNGTVWVTVTATDDMGNTASDDDDIIADNTPPSVVTAFDASPAHEECVLSWTNGTDTYYEGTVVRRASVVDDYPQYAGFVGSWPDVSGSYPADESDGAGVYDGSGTGHTDGVVSRNIYYYQAFSYDGARNYSAAATTARDLATNYWLGDISNAWGSWGYDGEVDDDDILKLSDSYGDAFPTDYPGNAECDIGPTVHPDWSRVGLPVPDDAVEFEDAMIFAMNYGVVVPKVVPFLPQEYDPSPLALGLGSGDIQNGEVEIALRLEGNSGEVKGLSAEVGYDTSELEFVSARLTEDMLSPLGEVFFWSGNEEGRTLIDVAVLGTGVTIGGSGDVAVLTFRALSDEYALEVEDARLRDVENHELNARLGDYASGGDTPLVFRLVGNTPNPFNPVTKIAYDVPRECEVSIRVYDVSGRVVRTLVDGVVEAGRREAIWDGRSDAGETVGSGIYFCTMEAPDFRQSTKMTLLK